jgi:hypothetical protein
VRLHSTDVWQFGYTSVEPVVQEFIQPFGEEAMRLFETNRTDSYLTAAALLYLNLGTSFAGDDARSNEYFSDGEQMAIRLRFIAHPPNGKPVPANGSALMEKARSHSAWGIFSWLM